MYRAASGAIAANLGEKRIRIAAEVGGVRTMTFQLAGVAKPLSSAGRITNKGHRIVLGDEDAYIQHKVAGRRIKLHKKGGRARQDGGEHPPPPDKEHTGVLGELGSTWQAED